MDIAQGDMESCTPHAEARGLDVVPFTIEKFRKNGDEETAIVLESMIYPEEVSAAVSVCVLGGGKEV